MEEDDMSGRAVEWAGTIKNVTRANQEILHLLAEHADEDGLVRGAYGVVKASPGTLTPLQARKAVEALVQGRLAVQQWNPDKYVWDVRLLVTK
jgi:hypothetical protein